MPRYGRKGGDGPTAGKVAAVYVIDVPDVGSVCKRSFDITSAEAVATGYISKQSGQPVIALWHEEPAWEGDFGRLTARRVK